MHNIRFLFFASILSSLFLPLPADTINGSFTAGVTVFTTDASITINNQSGLSAVVGTANNSFSSGTWSASNPQSTLNYIVTLSTGTINSVVTNTGTVYGAPFTLSVSPYSVGAVLQSISFNKASSTALPVSNANGNCTISSNTITFGNSGATNCSFQVSGNDLPTSSQSYNITLAMANSSVVGSTYNLSITYSISALP